MGAIANFTTTDLLVASADRHQNAKLERSELGPIDWRRATADFKHLIPLLEQANWKCDLFVCEPPDVYFEANLAAMLHFSTDRGEGLLIGKRTTIDAVLNDPSLRQHVWLRCKIDDTRDAIYWAKSHENGCQLFLDSLPNEESQYRVDRLGMEIQGSYQTQKNSGKVWDAVAREYSQQQKPDRDDYHLFLENGVIRARLTRFDEACGVDASEIWQLSGQVPEQLAIQVASRRNIERIFTSGKWRIDPELVTKFRRTLSEYLSVRAPLRPLPEGMRVGFIDEHHTLRCKASLVLGGKTLFEAGKNYPVTTWPIIVERLAMKPNMAGVEEEWLLSGAETMISLQDEDGGEELFVDSRHIRRGVTITRGGNSMRLTADFGFEKLIDHFDIPNVADVETTMPEVYRRNIDEIQGIQDFVNEPRWKGAEPVTFKPFQVDDVARSACHDGAVFALDPGLGKSICGILFAGIKVGIDWELSRLKKCLMPKAPVLIASPENLHDQLRAEWRKRFGIEAITLDSQETFLEMTKVNKKLKPGWYLSSYHQLGINKIKKLEVPQECERTFPAVAKLMHFYGITLDEAKEYALDPRDVPKDANMLLEKAIAACQERYKLYSEGVGDEGHGIRCIFGPSLVDLIHGQFEAVVLDEGVRIKSEDGIISTAIRALDPKYRLVLTATPIKNRLKDAFYLLHWASGGAEKPTTRFPYGAGDQSQFAADFNVCERNLTQEAKRREAKGQQKARKINGKVPRGRPGVEVCNVTKLWKIIAPLTLRRRKSDIGCDIVKRVKQLIRVPLGYKQHQVYKYHLEAVYVDKNGDEAIMPKLQALRSAAAAPTSDLLKQQIDGISNGLWRSDTDYTPKAAACLQIIEQCLRRNEQVIVFSALHEPLDLLSGRLTQAGVPHDVLDGRTSAAKRGAAAAEFQKGLAQGAKPVMLAGLQAMGEGNSFPLACNVVIYSYHWALDLFEQAINRCHRLNSVKDVNVYAIICQGTIERKLECSIDDKSSAAELSLDGKLLGEDSAELNLRELLKLAAEEFRTASEPIAESDLEKNWPDLRAALAEAWGKGVGSPNDRSLEIRTPYKSNLASTGIPMDVLLARMRRLQPQ